MLDHRHAPARDCTPGHQPHRKQTAHPDEVVLGGMMASSPLLTGVRETLYPRSLPRATRHLSISLSTLGTDAATVGLAALVVDREYSAAAVDAALNR